MFTRWTRTALFGAALVWGGLAQAYLSPDYTNPDYDPGGANYPWTPGPGDKPDYLTAPNWAFSPPLRKFVDYLPGIPGVTTYNAGTGYTADGMTLLGQGIPPAVADTTTYPGSDYYEIAVVQYEEQMHSDLPPTTLRGYVQLETSVVQGDHYALPNGLFGVHKPHYLGPIIVAQKDRPVRVKFVNLLPTGEDGKLFIPVDTTVMGSGPFEINYDPITKEIFQPGAPTVTGQFAQNRATLHLHGGRTPWISDGTPHQWITPAGEVTDYPTGVSVENVPDMPDPGPGAQTFYWTNQQSSRMLFYHDHAWGITRLNVYVGEAAGYLIQDPVELDLVNGTNVTGVNTSGKALLPADQVPLVIEDKTFVDADTVRLTDPLWNWGTGALDPATGLRAPKTGDLWWPHVYMPAQNPFDITGIAPFGRWAYGPYFYPATDNPYQPVPNPYYNQNCDPTGDPATTPGLLATAAGNFCQPLEVPGTPDVSWGAEAFMDTQTVNGTVYPTVTLAPKPYRFRILNASHDRFVNLALYKADTTVDPNTATDPLTTLSAPLCLAKGGCATETELKMVDAAPTAGWPATWPADGREGGVPDPTTAGPSWIMFGTEGGFLPKPVVIPPQPVTWNVNPSMFNVGNINGGSLILGPAERADVVVDFSGVPAGTTLILYNDGAAPWPALNPQYDFYTGNPDGRPSGSADTTLPGWGPNTRTIMQIKIEGAAGSAFDLDALKEAFTSRANHGGHPSVFQTAQDPIVAAQGDMNAAADPARYEAFLFPEKFDGYTLAYDPLTPFPTAYPNWGISRINDQSINFIGVDGSITYKYDNTKPLNNALAMERKSIHDEMGATFDEYGRMRAGLGLELSNRGPLQVNFIVQTYSDPSTELLEEEGIQVWKITHNGVDTHPIHFHLFDVQVLNRVGWDGFIRLPDPTEMGWKDTLRISPLEDTIVALRPVTPKVPFGIPESYRPLNPATPLGSNKELTQIDPTTGQARVNVNEFRPFDWEYVWHCHILSHEENDMMRSMIFNFVENLPSGPTGLAVSPAGVLTWTDPTPIANPATLGNGANEIGFRVERATTANGGSFATLATTLANATTYTDATVVPGESYWYRVVAFNAAGDSPASETAAIGPLAPITVDNRDAQFSTTGGGWTVSSSTPGFYGTDYVYRTAGTGTRTATWTFVVPAPGLYRVSARWTSSFNRATNAQYTVRNNGNLVGTVTVSQRTGGGVFNALGNFTLSAGTLTVTLSDAANGYVVADAAQMARTYAATLDNVGASFATVGAWTRSTSTAGFMGANYSYASAGTGTSTATWTFTVPFAATYDISALWTSTSSRASNAPYTILNNGTPVGPAIRKDQRTGGGTFQPLGSFALTPGTVQVRLSNDANGFVIADGMRVQLP